MCGDHHILLTNYFLSTGSPPHVRGPPESTPQQSLISRDHPRMCGDHFKILYICICFQGSPPHVRGPHNMDKEVYLMSGITPACAGTTQQNVKIVQRVWDHPRMCGDHHFNITIGVDQGGSPPHVRGPLEDKRPRSRVLGITPACAGTTAGAKIQPVSDRDHPRMCGDHDQQYVMS